MNLCNKITTPLYGVLLSSLLLANLASQAVAEDQEVPQIGAYFLLGNNYQPAAWGNPIVPVYFDEENRHEHILNRARAFIAFYAMASEELILGPLAGGLFENSNNTQPTLGLVVADYSIENEKLASPLREELQTAWGNTPVSNALLENVSRYQVGNVIEGNLCSLFVKGENVGDENPSYRVDSIVILAQNALSEDDIMLCFRNKAAVMFGLAPGVFDQVKTLNPRMLMASDFGIYPQLLWNTSVCRDSSPERVLECVESGIQSGYRYMLNNVLGKN